MTGAITTKRVRIAAADRLLRAAEMVETPGPNPGEKSSDVELQLKLNSLPMPVLLHMLEAGIEEIPSDEEQRRILEAYWARG